MSFDLMLKKAIKLHESGDLNVAEKLYRQILETNPKNADILDLLGLIAQEKNLDNQAIDLFYEAIKTAPTPFILFNLAFSLQKLGKNNEAKEFYLKSGIKEAYNQLGMMTKDVSYFDKALELDKNYLLVKINKAYVSKDIKALEKINDILAFYYLSKIYQENGDLEKALEKAIKSGDNLQIAELYLQLKEPHAAKPYLQWALELDPKCVSALINMANISHDKDAEDMYKQALEWEPNNFDGHLNYANLLLREKRFTEALEEYRKAVVINPDNEWVSYNLGLVLKETGEYVEALGLFLNAFLKKPEDENIALNIKEAATLLYQSGEEDEAMRIASNWLKTAPDNLFAKNLVKSLSGKGEIDIRYNQRLFDRFADNYEATLEKIKYTVPKKMAKILGNVKGKVLDLGCGTGLVAEALKKDSNTFIGVDISAEMVVKARAKGIYEDVVKSDIGDYLESKPSFDFAVAGDVFCYIGDLSKIFKLLKGKKICFSIEIDRKIKDYRLCETGRYKHNPLYIEKLFKENGFRSTNITPLVLRKENGKDVEGMIFVAE